MCYSIALTALNGSLGQTFAVPELCKDLCYITIKNVRSRGGISAIGLAGDLANLVMEEIERFDGTIPLLDHRTV